MNQEEFISTSKVLWLPGPNFLALCQARGGPYGLDLSTEYSLLSKLRLGLTRALAFTAFRNCFRLVLGKRAFGLCQSFWEVFSSKSMADVMKHYYYFLKSYSELKSQKLYIEDFKSYQHKNVTEHFSHIELIRQNYNNHGTRLRVFLFILIIKK